MKTCVGADKSACQPRGIKKPSLQKLTCPGFLGLGNLWYFTIARDCVELSRRGAARKIDGCHNQSQKDWLAGMPKRPDTDD